MRQSTVAAMHCGKALVVGVAATLTLFSVASAQEQQPARAPATAVAPNAARPAAVADAPNARLVALIRPPGVLILNKGVQTVTNPGAGIYCILPTAATGITPTTAVPTVSVEYFYSKQNEVSVEWAHAGHPCGNTRFAVYTFADPSRSGLYRFSDSVGFVISVP